MSDIEAKLIFALMLVSVLVGPVCCDCWDDEKFNGVCYDIVYSKSTWYDAQEYCQLYYDAELASIHSQEENDFIEDMSGYTFNEIWLGLHEINVDSYMWSDGTPYDYENSWREGEPNDAFGNEECVMMVDGVWNDDNCNNKHYAICKERNATADEATVPPLIEGKCPDGFLSEDFSNKCYMIGGTDGLVDYDQAKQDCADLGGELGSIGSIQEQSFILLLMEEHDANAWLGYYYINTMFSWIDNSEITFTNLEAYDSWDIPYDCVAFNVEDDNDFGLWKITDCDTSLLYLCQTTRESSSETDPNAFADQYTDSNCADDYYWYHDLCYKFYTDAKSWEDANATCYADNSQMAVTFDEFDMARLTYEIIENNASQAWIGVTYKRVHGTYIWDNQYTVQQTFWHWDQPDYQTDTACVSVKDGYWYDEDCATEYPFLCVAGDLSDYIPATMEPTLGYCANSDHKPWGDHCYSIALDELRDWYDAREKCETQGMDLVSIHSRDENDFLEDFVDAVRESTNTWIGLTHGSDADGGFRWSDGTDYNFDNWIYRDPDSEPEECVLMDRSGFWMDTDCGTTTGFICKTDKVYPTSSPPQTTFTTIPTTTTSLPTTTIYNDDPDVGGIFSGDDDTGGSQDDQDGGGSDSGAATNTEAPDDTGDEQSQSDTDSKIEESGESSAASGLSGGALATTIIFVIVLVVVISVVTFLTVTKRWPQVMARIPWTSGTKGSGEKSQLYEM